MGRRRLNPFKLQNQIIISESVLNTLFEGEQSLKETTKREPFQLQVWKNPALWIVYSTGGEWGNHAIRPGMEGNCQMIYNPNLANFKTQCWTNTSAYKEWCVAVGSTITKTCEISLLAHFCWSLKISRKESAWHLETIFWLPSVQNLHYRVQWIMNNITFINLNKTRFKKSHWVKIS